MPAFYWTTDAEEAKKEQLALRDLVTLNTTLLRSLDFKRGIAIGTAYDENTKRSFAVGVSFNGVGAYSSETIKENIEVDFPYVPGLLAFRVGPPICVILDKVADQFDLLLFDGQGIAHRDGFGLASHIGVLYNKPAIGMTRHNLYGRFTDPPRGRFNSTEVLHPQTGAPIGYSVSFGEQCDPCYISPGHHIALKDALTIVCRIAGDTSCFPRCLQRAHAIANSTAKSFWRNQSSGI